MIERQQGESKVSRSAVSRATRGGGSGRGGKGRVSRGRGGRGRGNVKKGGRGRGKHDNAHLISHSNGLVEDETNIGQPDNGLPKSPLIDLNCDECHPRKAGGRSGKLSGRVRSRGRGGRGPRSGRKGRSTGRNEVSDNPMGPNGTEVTGSANSRDLLALTTLSKTLESVDDSAVFDGKNEELAFPVKPEEGRPPCRLILPSPPQRLSSRTGVPTILSRNSHPPSVFEIHPKQAEQVIPIGMQANSRDGTKTNFETESKVKNRMEFSEKSQNTEGESPSCSVSATEAIAALPGQEVSITAKTLVHVRRHVALAPQRLDEAKSTRSRSRKVNSKKKKGLSKDHEVNQKAAMNFNKLVRTCVERSDPDAMREILHDKRNHKFALDKNVLEVVMKAYVMAAMFEDALFCLRNCALPGTLSTVQTERILTCMPQNLRNSSAYTAADMINALCIASEFDNPTSRTYFLRVVRGISLEFLEEVMSARDRICSAPCERLVRAAVCIVDARLKRGKKPTELLVVAGDQLGVFVPETVENRGIQAGDAVSLLPYAGPYPMSAESLDRNMIEATVTNTNPMVLRLQDKANASLHAMLTEPVEGNVYRIDKLANRMGFNRQLAAAVAIASPLGDSRTRDTRRPSPELIRAITAMDENIDRVMKLPGGFSKGELTSTAALCAEAVPWNHDDELPNSEDSDAVRMASALALEKYGALEGLNDSQRLAVEGAVTNRLTLVQGPPGTGKTAVAIRILQHWARLASKDASKGENPPPVLATSDSNIAVDNLVEGCAAAGLRVVRLGRPEAIRPELLRFCIDRPPSTYGQGSNQQYLGGSSMAFRERMKHLKRAQVICCTCIGSGGDFLDAMTFDRVLVDEATQATEPAVLVPLMRGCRQLVLVGDHCQLPPTVLSTRAEEEGHGVPLFSRMVACGVPPFMLDTQYRMHPCIAMFPSDLFYGGKLRNGVSAPERRPLAGFPWPREEFPVAFVPVKGVEVDDGVSKLNEAEAAAACDAVAALLSGGQCAASDIAVVTPYAAQARLIRRMTRRLTQNSGPPFIEVSSVDGFQGREKEAVVFSAVRSNDFGAVGFISDWRRVNVSFTRARRALIVIGNDQTLRRGDPDTWMPWLAWADAHGLNMDKPGVPRGRYEPEQLRRVRGGTTAAEMLKDVLERQHAQLKTAERQLEKAEKKAVGHIIGSSGDEYFDDGVGYTGGVQMGKCHSLEEDLARLTNTDGNWDDSDGEASADLHRSVSQPTLTSLSSSNERQDASDEDDGAPVDAWDL